MGQFAAPIVVSTIPGSRIPPGGGTGPVIIPPSGGVPINSVLPSLSGGAADGESLTSSTGTWQGAPTSYAYQWFKDGVEVPGETADTIALGSSDVGSSFACEVIASNEHGPGAPAFTVDSPNVSTAEAWAAAVAVWTDDTRTLATGTPTPPVNYVEQVAAAVWTNSQRTLS